MVDITDSEREAFHGGNNYVDQSKQKHVNKTSSSTALSITKVFLYMFMGLAITAVVAFGLGAVVYYQILNAQTDLEVQSIAIPYFVGLIVSAVALIVDMIVINFVTLRGKHSILVPAIIYAVLVGVLFSFLAIAVDWRLIGMAFGITAGVFLIMSFIAFLSKGNMSPILLVVFGLLIGAGFLALFNWIFMLATGSGFTVIYWIVTFAIFAVVMLVTIYDLWRMKKIAEAGAMNNNIALYCAFTMYVDFINIFIRILYFLILIFGRSRR